MKSSERPYDLSAVRISLASPEDIRSFSYGEVTHSRSINSKTMTPERGGLFCEVLFGPLKEYECSCGALQGMEYEGRICVSCGVEVNSSRVRRYRMGHIELSAPIPHLWFFKVRPFYLSTFLSLRLKDLEEILTSQREVVFHVHQKRLPGKKPYLPLSVQVLRGTGHDVIHSYLSQVDLVQEYFYQKHTLFHTFSESSHSGFVQSQIFAQELKKFRLIYWFLVQKRRPQWMMFTALPVLPPELRPFLIMPNQLIMSSDLNLLYKKILDRNRRLRSLKQLSQEYSSTLVTTSFVYNEISMLQHSIDCLIENGRRGKPLLNKKKLPLKSLAHILKGKEGRFRMNLLGKRVDLSGRTVISVGPRLKLTQCGLPLSMAVNLFQSFLYKKLPPTYVRKIAQLHHPSSFAAWGNENKKTLLSSGYAFSSEVLSLLSEIVYSHPILLNRAPTLHRLNVQAFQPIVINSKAIQLHPLVCSSFNADFDGDQMAVHVPLSFSSQIESRMLMMTYNNIINPSNGSVLIMPSQDVIFGLYYASLIVKSSKPLRFTRSRDLNLALLQKHISLHTEILYRIEGEWKNTTPGRVFLSLLLMSPTGLEKEVIPFDRFNTILTKKKVHDILRLAHDLCLQEDFLYFLDQVMAYGFYYAHQAGISMSLNDVIIPSLKKRVVHKATEKSLAAVIEHRSGSISNEEKIDRVVREWSSSQEYVTSTILRDVYQSQSNEVPPIYMLIYSGARGSILQMRQLSGLRGLMVKPSGEIIEMPIASNFKEGLRVFEYFHSTHGARKGVIDTSIRTATSGYLTRRLVHASQGLVVTEEDCGTPLGIQVRTQYSEGKETVSLQTLALGRTLAENVYDLDTGKLLDVKGTILGTLSIQKFLAHQIESIQVRTPLTCQSPTGVCQACYGSHLSTGQKVLIGEPVGILASQSIGEPGTQLTMRTFHMGGVLQGTSEVSAIRTKESGRVFLKQASLFALKEGLGSFLCISRDAKLYILSSLTDQILVQYEVPYGSILSVQDGELVEKDELLLRWNPNYEPVFNTSLSPSVVVCRDFLKETTYKQSSTSLKRVRRILGNHESTEELFPRIVLTDEKNQIQKFLVSYGKERYRFSRIYYLQEDDICFVNHGDRIEFGQLLYFVPRRMNSTVDITGGLSKISQLFESSLPQLPKGKVLSARDSFFFVHPSRFTSRVKWRITEMGFEEHHDFPTETKLKIRSLTYIRKGQNVSLGYPSFEEILDVYGTGRALFQFQNDIQAIYRANGVTIHEKHIELILNRMYGRLTVVDPGQTTFLMKEEVNREDFLSQNLLSLAKGLRVAKGNVVVRGVTAISLESSSFLSAAAFQNTSFVLSKSAMQGRMDTLRGLSENVILGRLSPIGTGAILSPHRYEKEHSWRQ